MIDYAAAREAMVDRQVRTADVTRYPIIAAMLAVPREDFLPAALRPVAYLGEHVPLAPGRVLLDPRVFAKLLDALDVGPGGSRPRPRLRPRLLDRGAGADGRGGGGARVRPGHGRRGRGAARGAWRRQRRGAGRAARRRRGRARAVRRHPGRGRASRRCRTPSRRSSRSAAASPRSSPRAPAARRGSGSAPRTGSPGGVSSMPRPRCCRGSRRRKHLNSEPMRRIVRRGARTTGQPGASSARGTLMHRHSLKSLLLSSTLAAVLAFGGGAGAGRLAGRRARQGLPDQPAAGIDPRGAARGGRDPAAGARRAPAAGRRLGDAQHPDHRRGDRGPVQPAPRRRSTPRSSSSTTATPRRRSSRRATRSPPGAPTSRASSSRCCSTRWRPTSGCAATRSSCASPATTSSASTRPWARPATASTWAR